MKTFCYSIRDANNGNKLVGGTVHTDTMEDAAITAARRSQLVIEHQDYRTVLWRRDRRVYLYVTAVAEHVLVGHLPEFYTIRPVEEEEEEEECS